MNEPTRMLIVDDHILFRQGLASLIGSQPDFKVVGEAGSVQEACQLACSLIPDLILMDFSLPDGTGADAARLILKELPDMDIVFITVHESDEFLMEAVRSGAKGYLLKNVPVASPTLMRRPATRTRRRFAAGPARAIHAARSGYRSAHRRS